MKKTLKILLAVAMLAAVTAAFFGVTCCAWVCRIQPSASWAFLAVLALTPLLGRFFCECLCPLGILQSFVNWLFHPKTHVRRVCTRLPSTRPQLALRLVVLAAFLGLVGAGFGGVAYLVTPYSIYGRALTLAVPGLVVFGVVLVLAALGKGRVWCNWVCPAGTLFTLFARKSALCHQVGPGCANCRACFPKADKPDAPAAVSEGEGLTRREALKGFAVVTAAQAAEKTTDGGFAPVSLPGVPKRPASVLPPGAAPREVFTRTCVSCGLCIANCPEKCLTPSVRFSSFGQPEMDFRFGHCRVACTRCGEVCPTVALRRLVPEEKKAVHIGHAIWKKDLCLRTTEDVPCTACQRKCPVEAIHLVAGFPVIDKTVCLGCGACEHVCPVRPMPAIFVKGFDRQVVVSRMAEADLVAEMRKRIVEDGQSSVAAMNGCIVGVEAGHGLEPLLRLLDGGKLKGALVVDRVIGRAAAAILVAGGARKVHALLMSDEAKAFLDARGVACAAEKRVPKILNRELSGACPLEDAVKSLDNPETMLKALRVRIKDLAAKR